MRRSNLHQFPSPSQLRNNKIQYMLDIIISSETRIKLLIKFFLVKGNKSYLRSLEREFDESTNALKNLQSFSRPCHFKLAVL